MRVVDLDFYGDFTQDGSLLLLLQALVLHNFFLAEDTGGEPHEFLPSEFDAIKLSFHLKTRSVSIHTLDILEELNCYSYR
jgi:hypothetical protein